MAHYFISDLHLEARHPKMAEGFFGLLKGLKEAGAQATESLYILGDFFETWLGDDYQDELSERIKHSLKQLSDSGIAVYFMHGNRDFLMGEQFAKECGAKLIDEGTVITIGDDTALLMHGDSLCTRDVEYMKVRQMLRNPLWKADFLSKPMEARVAFAAHARAESQSSQQMKANDIMDVTQDEVDNVMTNAGVSRLIHGHTHRPNTHLWEFSGEQRERIVLGDWSDENGWMIRWEKDSAPQLSKFSF